MPTLPKWLNLHLKQFVFYLDKSKTGKLHRKFLLTRILFNTSMSTTRIISVRRLSLSYKNTHREKISLLKESLVLANLPLCCASGFTALMHMANLTSISMSHTKMWDMWNSPLTFLHVDPLRDLQGALHKGNHHQTVARYHTLQPSLESARWSTQTFLTSQLPLLVAKPWQRASELATPFKPST